MTLSANISKLSSVFDLAARQIKKVQDEAPQAKDPDTYIAKNKETIIKKLKSELSEIKAERQQILQKEWQDSQEKLNKHYGRERASRDSYHFLRAERILQAKDLDEAKTIYRRQLDRMTPEDRQRHRFSYDDALYELQAKASPGTEAIVEKVIDEYRNGLEVVYLTQSKIDYEIYKNSNILDSAITMAIGDIEKGTGSSMPWAQIVNDIKENAKNNVLGNIQVKTEKGQELKKQLQMERDTQSGEAQKEIDSVIKDNPYLEGDKAHEEGDL